MEVTNEKYERNVEIVRKKLAGARTCDLAKEYKTSLSNLNRIITDTQNKYPEQFVGEIK